MMAKTPQRSNVIVRDVRDNEGRKLATIIEPYDGTEDGAACQQNASRIACLSSIQMRPTSRVV